MAFEDLNLEYIIYDPVPGGDPKREGYPDDELIAKVETELGYKLPASYIELMRFQNGGMTEKGYPMPDSFRWGNHAEVETFLGIGFSHQDSLCGEFGAKFWMEEWGYPNIGVPICESSTSGHEMIYLDYRECGPDGEPKVVYVEQELDYKITVLAENFEKFVRALQPMLYLPNPQKQKNDNIGQNQKYLWPYQKPTIIAENPNK